jgi:hypothetical protein
MTLHTQGGRDEIEGKNRYDINTCKRILMYNTKFFLNITPGRALP